MREQRPSMWTVVKAAYQLAISCFVGLRGATGLAFLVQFAIEIVVAPETNGSVEEMTRVMADMAEAVLLSPYAILIHRRIILHDRDDRYLTAATSARVVRFAGVALLLVLINVLATHAMVLSQSSDWFLPIALICAVVSAVCDIRLLLAFPAIATDGSSTPVSDSFRDSKGSSWWLFFLLILAAAPIVPFQVGIGYYLNGMSDSIGAMIMIVLGSVVGAFGYAVAVALASHLYAARGEWRAGSTG
jgi:hypothetical protein